MRAYQMPDREANDVEPDEVVWLRDLDGTGSMHPCAPHDPGAIRYIRAPAVLDALTEARKFIESEYRDPSAESDGEWLAPEARAIHMAICFALAGAEVSQ